MLKAATDTQSWFDLWMMAGVEVMEYQSREPGVRREGQPLLRLRGGQILELFEVVEVFRTSLNMRVSRNAEPIRLRFVTFTSTFLK